MQIGCVHEKCVCQIEIYSGCAKWYKQKLESDSMSNMFVLSFECSAEYKSQNGRRSRQNYLRKQRERTNHSIFDKMQSNKQLGEIFHFRFLCSVGKRIYSDKSTFYLKISLIFHFDLFSVDSHAHQTSPSFAKGGQQTYGGSGGDDNRANQKNPNHEASGPGNKAGYTGDGSQADRDNHANQLNPNHEKTNN